MPLIRATNRVIRNHRSSDPLILWDYLSYVGEVWIKWGERKTMNGGKLAIKRRHSIVNPIYNRVDLKPEEFCHRRDLAFTARLTKKQMQALEALMAKRDLFL